jgi:hypothetical protein
LSYPHPRQPTVRFLNPKGSEWSSIKIQRNLTRSWRQDEQSVIRSFPYRDVAAAQIPTDQARQIELQKEIWIADAHRAVIDSVSLCTLMKN